MAGHLHLFPKCHTGDGSCNNYTYDSKHKKLAELHDDAAFLVLMSVIAMILVAVKVIWFPYLAMGAMGASLFLFLGTLIIGDKRARTELKRRFHI